MIFLQLDSLTNGEADKPVDTSANGLELSVPTSNSETSLIAKKTTNQSDPLSCIEPTVPHGKCKDTNSDAMPGILHPGSVENSDKKVGVACCHRNIAILCLFM